MTCIRRNLDTQNCCNAWQKGIRTINQTYPDDNREFEIRAGNGILIQPITAGILITNSSAASSFIAGTNIQLTPSGTDVMIETVDGPTFTDTTTINATLQVNGDIIQNGAAYETHAEKVYTTNDYIIMRDGAVSGLGSGDYSGFQVKLYDGVNDGRLVIDNSGTARVGDVGNEQPLLTRDEAADLTDGDTLVWDSANSKAVTEAIPSAISTALAGKQATLTPVTTTINVNGMTIKKTVYGKLAIYSYVNQSPTATGTFTIDTVNIKQTFMAIGFDGAQGINNYIFADTLTAVKINVFTLGNYTGCNAVVILE